MKTWSAVHPHSVRQLEIANRHRDSISIVTQNGEISNFKQNPRNTRLSF